MALSTAFSVVSIIAGIALLIGGKKKMKKAKNAVVGKRIWSDHVIACAYYSPRTVMMYFNVILTQGNRFLYTEHLPKADFWGDEYDIGDAILNPDTEATTNVGAAECFTIEYDGIPSNTVFNYLPNLLRQTKIAKFSRGDGNNPEFKTHTPGVATFSVNQGFMGVNSGAIPTYYPILTVVPGTVWLLKKYGDLIGAGDDSYWIRIRKSNFCGDVIDLNPMVILTDLLLDLYTPNDIDWSSAASVGARLITAFPYMWFSMAVRDESYSNIFETMTKIARVAIGLNYEGKIKFKLLYDPFDDTAIATQIEVDRIVDITLEKESVDSARIVNEFKGRYAACRIDEVYDGSGEDKYEYLYNMAAAKPAINYGDIFLTGVRKRQSVDLDFLHWSDDAALYLEDLLDIFYKPLVTGSIKTSFAYNYLDVGDKFELIIDLE